MAHSLGLVHSMLLLYLLFYARCACREPLSSVKSETDEWLIASCKRCKSHAMSLATLARGYQPLISLTLYRRDAQHLQIRDLKHSLHLPEPSGHYGSQQGTQGCRHSGALDRVPFWDSRADCPQHIDVQRQCDSRSFQSLRLLLAGTIWIRLANSSGSKSWRSDQCCCRFSPQGFSQFRTAWSYSILRGFGRRLLVFSFIWRTEAMGL